MKSLRALTCLTAFAVILGVVEVGCGSSDDSGAAPGTSPNDPDGGGPGKGPGDGDGGPKGPSVDGPFTFRDRLAGWSAGYTGGFYRAHGYAISGKRLFSIPDAISPTLGAVTVVDVSTAKPRVYALPVTGNFPAGTVESFVYEPGIDRIVMIVRSPKATKVDIVTITVGDKEATFTTMTQAGPALTSNSLIGPIYASGGAGNIVAGLGNTAASFTIAGTTATWTAEVAAQIFQGNHSGAMEDPAHGRVFAFGKDVYDPAAMKGHVEPNIQQLSLAAPYPWTAKPFGGEAPPIVDSFGGGYNFTVYDDKGARILVSAPHDGMCGTMPCMINSLYSFDLNTNMWTKLQDNFSSPHVYSGAVPFLVQQDARRILEPSDGVLVATSLDTSTNPLLSDVTLPQDGDLGPAGGGVSTVLADNRILSTDGRAFRILDPSVAAPSWSRFGTVPMPPALDRGASISADPKTGEVLIFGITKASGAGTASVSELYVLSKDGKAAPKVTTASSPPARTNHGALVADGTLYVAGGSTAAESGVGLDDVWAFDRASATWTKLATLPAKLQFPTLSLGADGALLVTGLIAASSPQDNATSSQVFAVDRKTHVVKALDAVPAKFPLWSVAAYRGCFIGYESGDTVDGSSANIWRCSVENGAIKWTSTVSNEHDFALHDLRGATAPDGLRAYFVGRHLWEAIGK